MNKYNRIPSEAKKFLQRGKLSDQKAILLNLGLSNLNYLLGNKAVFKIPYDSQFIFLNQGQIDFQNQASQVFIAPRVLDYNLKKGYLITEYLKDYKPISASDINLIQIKNIIKCLKTIHSFKIPSLDKLDYVKLLDFFRLKVSPRKRFYFAALENSSLLEVNPEPSHFDLVSGNILTDSQSDIKIIDFEMSISAPEYFDLTSLLFENDFSEEIRKTIVDIYFASDTEKKAEYLSHQDELAAIADLLWYHWALARSISCSEDKKESYIKISESKKEDLLKRIRKS